MFKKLRKSLQLALADPPDPAVAIVVRVVRSGNEDPYTVDAHLEDAWVTVIRSNSKLERDIVQAVKALVHHQ
jgi:hypothetical protein